MPSWRAIAGLTAPASVVAVATIFAQTAPAPHPERAFLAQYCVTCHNQKLNTAGLQLDTLDPERAGEHAATWELVIQKLSTGAMPPRGMPRPDAKSSDAFVHRLEAQIDSESAAHPNPGRPAIHRLNRTEYANAARDLLDTVVDADAILPPDDSADGFDNIGSALSVSPMLLERYVSAARIVSRLAIGDPEAKPTLQTYSLPKFLIQDDRTDESLPFGSRGGMTIWHQFPADGEYTVKVNLRRDYRDYVIGNAIESSIEIRLDGKRIKLFTIGGQHKGYSAPLFSTNELGDAAQEQYERTLDKGLDVRFPAQSGRRLIEVDFLKDAEMPEGPQRPPLTARGLTQYKGGEASVDNVVVGGPYNPTGLSDTPSRRAIFICHPGGPAEEAPCARKILSALARRAYRRPVTDADLQTLMDFYQAGRKKGGFEAGVGMALRRILAGPEFLFRIERDPAGIAPNSVYRIDDLALASRLSFFLWSSIPDEPLLDLAIAGRLHDPAVLEQQVRRMLADVRSDSLINNFGAEWLYLRNLDAAKPDSEEFPEFDENLRQAFQQETRLFLIDSLRNDRSVPDLLAAGYTFLNERLARFYGIPNVYGSHFRRVELTNPDRDGLLGKGSILTVTSYANRTAPTIRGKWILENILGTPPPPPPPNVPALQEGAAKSLTMRQRMEQHRANPVCASCHAQMDPLGFALENFDGVGKWRGATETHAPIDASGVLPDGTKFEGPEGLRTVLLHHSDQFVTTVTEKLLTYALGREVEFYDRPAIRKIICDAQPGGYRWSSLILGIVKSAPFQMRLSEENP